MCNFILTLWNQNKRKVCQPQNLGSNKINFVLLLEQIFIIFLKHDNLNYYYELWIDKWNVFDFHLSLNQFICL